MTGGNGMPSLQFFLFRLMMPFLRQSQGRMKVWDGDALVRFRERSERLANMIMSVPREVTLVNSNIGGVTGDWLIPQNAPDDPVIVFLHGGGIIFGWSNPNRRILSYIAKFSGLRAFGMDYRLAPEHPYPAAHEDCFTVYQTLARQGKKIVLVGESSGGVLALATLLRARAEGLPQPSLCALISPLVDYRFQDARNWKSGDVFAHPGYIVGLHQHYIAGHDTRTPDFSPVDADLRGLAPLYVLAGEHDLLRSESERLADAAKRNDLKMELTIWPHVWHSWHLFVPQLPEATQAYKMLGGVIRRYISR
jgi:acetyl esterase/lipase